MKPKAVCTFELRFERETWDMGHEEAGAIAKKIMDRVAVIVRQKILEGEVSRYFLIEQRLLTSFSRFGPRGESLPNGTRIQVEVYGILDDAMLEMVTAGAKFWGQTPLITRREFLLNRARASEELGWSEEKQ